MVNTNTETTITNNYVFKIEKDLFNNYIYYLIIYNDENRLMTLKISNIFNENDIKLIYKKLKYLDEIPVSLIHHNFFKKDLVISDYFLTRSNIVIKRDKRQYELYINNKYITYSLDLVTILYSLPII